MKSLLSSPDAIVDALRADILDGRLEPGVPLRQDEVARTFGVSHIPVREALRRLEAEGLVAIRPRRGAIVADLSASELEELNDMRVALESSALRLAIPNITKTQLAKAARILDRNDADQTKWGALNTEFHCILNEAANRPRMLATIRSLQRNVERYLHHEVDVLDNLAASQREHRRLLKLIEQGKTDEACTLLTGHIAEPGRILAAQLREAR